MEERPPQSPSRRDRAPRSLKIREHEITERKTNRIRSLPRNAPCQADSEKTKTFKRKIHPLRGWIFIMRQAFSAAYPPSRHGAPTGILQSRFLDKSCAAFLSAVTVPSIRFFHRYRGTAHKSASRDRNIGGLAVFILYFKASSVPDKRKRIPFALALRSRGVQPITPSRARAVGKRY